MIQQVRPGDHADQLAGPVYNRVAWMTLITAGEEALSHQVADRHRGRDGHHVRRHDLANAQPLEWINGVLAADGIAPPRDLLGEDRSLHHQHSEAVGHRGGDQESREGVDVLGQLQGEDDAGQGAAHRSSERGGHAHQGPECAVAAGQDRRLDRPERASHDQQGGEHAAGSSRAQRDRPDNRLDEDQCDKGTRVVPSGEQVVDDIIADPQRPGLYQSADPDDQPSECRPPHPVDGQAVEGILGRVDGRRQHQCQHPRQQPDDDRCDQVDRRQDPMCRYREHRPDTE